jgi:hypothetical protein
MKKFGLTLFTCIALSLFPTIAFAENTQDEQTPASITVPTKSKRQMAREVIAELGVGRQYDLFFWNSADISTGTGVRTKFSAWLQTAIVRFAGWKYVESQYVSRLEANFSELELKELLELSKRPLLKKLLKTEIEAYEETAAKRTKLLWQFWNNFQIGNIEIPKDLLNK